VRGLRHLRLTGPVALGLACFAAVASATHDTGHPFSGEWTTRYERTGAVGELTLAAVDRAAGERALLEMLGRACGPGAQYYTGQYRRPRSDDFEGVTGTVTGCAEAKLKTVFTGRWKARLDPDTGDLSLTTVGSSFTGVYRRPGFERPDYKLAGAFEVHTPTDGSVDEQAAATPTVNLKGNQANPRRTTVRSGTQVQICNRDGTPHRPYTREPHNGFRASVAPGRCIRRAFANATRRRILVRVRCAAHPRERWYVAVLPPHGG
jgi:hypothetical protein